MGFILVYHVLQTNNVNIFGQSWFDESNPDTDSICRPDCYDSQNSCPPVDSDNAKSKCEKVLTMISPTGLFKVSVYILITL